MAQATIEERVAELEKQVSRLVENQEGAGDAEKPWWDQWFGAFRDNADFDEAMRLGAEYRKSLPNPADQPDALEF